MNEVKVKGDYFKKTCTGFTFWIQQLLTLQNLRLSAVGGRQDQIIIVEKVKWNTDGIVMLHSP